MIDHHAATEKMMAALADILAEYARDNPMAGADIDTMSRWALAQTTSAQTHATLAIADQLKRIADRLDLTAKRTECGATEGTTEYPCIRAGGHTGPHMDRDGDTW